MMVYGKKIELFLVNGTADSLVLAELRNWSGKAIKIPRTEVAGCGRKDFTRPGVYFLFCKAENEDKDAVYIGEAENIKARLVQHLRDASSGNEEYYWNTAVIFTGDDLDKALIRYLEDKLVKEAREANRFTVLTKNTCGKAVIKESDQAVMEEYIDKLKILINALGYKVLEPVADPSEAESRTALHLAIGNAKAEGLLTTEGFVVRKGAVINEKTNEPSLNANMSDFRRKVMESGRVENLVTTEDILFSSPSAAADFVLGYAVSGPKTWKDKNGTPLRELNID